MIFGTRLGANAPARPTPVRSVRLGLHGILAVCCLAAMVAPLTGCGGGSSSANTGGSTPQSGNATVTGRIINNSTNAAVAGAIVTVNGQTFTTSDTGQFSFSLPSGRSDLFLRVTGSGANTFYDTGRYNETNLSLGTTGIQLPVLNGV